VEFLRKELDGVPEDLRQVALSQLEDAIRAACTISHIHATHDNVLPYMAICVKISNVIDFLQKTKRALQDKQG
jgi:hypothetical protein